jgi:hypothetical protein
MNARFRSLFACCAAGALAVSLAACGPDEGLGTGSAQLDAGLVSGWSMTDLAGVDPAFYADDHGDLPSALPMQASYEGDYGYAPAYDYAPEHDDRYYEPLDDSAYYDDGYYDDGYYEDGYYEGGYYDAGYEDPYYDDAGYYDLGSDGSDYALLALAVSLAGMLGDAPPDYGFAYDDVSPWAWRTGDGYYRYAEPIRDGYRYYYYEPGAHRPFLVCDPYYSYGYRDDRLVAIYDRGGRRVDPRRADRQLGAAKAYYARADSLYEAAHRDRFGVAAPVWERQRDRIARERSEWVREQAERPGWRQWEARNAPKLQRQWSDEALVRRDAERGFDNWRKADYRTPPPKFYSRDVHSEQVQKLTEFRRDHAKQVEQRRREFAEQRVEQQREARQIAARAPQAEPRRERSERLAERRDPVQRAERQRSERVIAREAPQKPRERVAQRREAPAVAMRPSEARKEARPAAQRQPVQRQAAKAQKPPRQEQARPRAAERQTAAPQPRQQVRREPVQATPKKRPQPAEARQQVRREPAARAAPERTEPQRPAQAARQARPKPERQAPQARVERPEPRQVQARAERPQVERREQQARAPQPRPEPRLARAERQQVERSQPQAQARAPRPEPQPRLERVREMRQPAAQPARLERQQRQEAKQEPRPEKQEARTEEADPREKRRNRG